ncbi:MAG: RNA polymerase sigma factor [Oscillospiraceae bacterium]|nr:RNA polymerase sigma factor [Oscillospiraceae bacterium]
MIEEAIKHTVKSFPARDEEKVSQSIEEIYERHVSMIYRVSFSYMKNKADTDDIVSEVFLKLLKTDANFQNAEHEKAWLLRTAINLCKDSLKHWRRKNENIDDYANLHSETPFQTNETLQAVMKLPERYKDVIYLYYYEGYTSEEAAKILKKPHSTIRNHLHEARKLLKGVLENEE